MAAESLALYDSFYAVTRAVLDELVAVHSRVVVLDIHSYNHRRDGAAGPIADPAANPEVNVGSASVDRTIWGPLVDGFLADLAGRRVAGHALDVRENIKFQGGHFPRWINGAFPDNGVRPRRSNSKKPSWTNGTARRDEPHFAELSSALESIAARPPRQPAPSCDDQGRGAVASAATR